MNDQFTPGGDGASIEDNVHPIADANRPINLNAPPAHDRARIAAITVSSVIAVLAFALVLGAWAWQAGVIWVGFCAAVAAAVLIEN